MTVWSILAFFCFMISVIHVRDDHRLATLEHRVANIENFMDRVSFVSEVANCDTKPANDDGILELRP